MEEKQFEESAAAMQDTQDAPVYDEKTAVKEARRAFGRVECNLALYLISALVVMIVISVAVEIVTNKSLLDFSNDAAIGISFGCTYLVGFPLYLLLSKFTKASPPAKNKLSAGQFVGFLCIAQMLMIVGNFIGMIFTSIVGLLTGVDISDSTLSDSILVDNSYLVLFVAVFIAPVIEEILFRKVFIDRVRKFGEGKAILASGILFGIFHGNFTQFFYAALVGTLFAYIYTRTGNILYTIGLHLCMNTLGSAVPMFAMKNLDLNNFVEMASNNDIIGLLKISDEFLPMLGNVILSYSLVFAGVAIFCIYLSEHQFHLEPPEVKLPKGKNFSVVVFNYGMILFALVMLYEFVTNIIG